MTRLRIPAACLIGAEATPTAIEVAVTPSTTPQIHTDTAFRHETPGRTGAALRASAVLLAPSTYTFSLACAGSVPGRDHHLDLPIAVGAIAASGGVPGTYARWMLAGELGLDGSLYPVRGAILLTTTAKEMGLAGIILPRGNIAEAACLEGVEIRAADSLGDVVRFLRGELDLDTPPGTGWPLSRPAEKIPPDFADVKGHEEAKHALQVAAAGGHGILLFGPPGSGKTMLAQRLPGILPPLTRAEAVKITGIHSAARLLLGTTQFVDAPPFRNPHPTTSDAGFLGGGSGPYPGEVSLAHGGVLFLDELAEFRSSTLDQLRAALTEGRVVLTRSGVSVVYPSSSLLVAALNPCPCGYLGHPLRRCTCTPTHVERYRRRIPTHLLDRMDLRIFVPPVEHRQLTDRTLGTTSEAMRAVVERAREIQRARFGEGPDVRLNAQMTAQELRAHCAVGDQTDSLLRTAITRRWIKPRDYYQVLKIARTIADLGGAGDISLAHVQLAIQYCAPLG